MVKELMGILMKYPKMVKLIFRVRQLIKETADDVVKLVDYYDGVGSLKISKIGMIGISMGGFTTFRVGIIDDRVKVLTPYSFSLLG